jgi:uncharacterized protein
VSGKDKPDMTASLPVVHLELHTGDLARARALCEQLCGWRAERIETVSGSYLTLELGSEDTATDLARQLGASVLLEAREGPAGWRSVIATPGAGEIALWQQESWRP